MITLPIGFTILVSILFAALHGVALKTLLNPEALLLVVLGCIGILVLSSSSTQLVGLFRELLSLARPTPPGKQVDASLIALAKSKKSSVGNVHPLISYAQELWEVGVDAELFVVLLSHRLEDLKRTSEGAVATLKNLSKFPPAMGMTGTVIGLVQLFGSLTESNKNSLGPSLAFAMTATLYGLVTANMLLLPLADRLHVVHLERSKVADKVYGTLLLIHEGEPQDVIQVELNGQAA